MMKNKYYSNFFRADITRLHTQDIVIMIRQYSEKNQEEFAKVVGKNFSTISKVETGYRNLYLHTFLEWCRINNIKVTIEKRN